MSTPIIFRVTVDGHLGRIVLNPFKDDAEEQLVVELLGTDAAGGERWTALEYRFSKRFMVAALLYASAFGAQPGQPIEVGRVERSELRVILPASYIAALRPSNELCGECASPLDLRAVPGLQRCPKCWPRLLAPGA